MLTPLENLLEVDPQNMQWLLALKRDDGECPALYEKILDDFIKYGIIIECDDDASPLMRYVIDLLNTPFIQIKVLTNPLVAAYFKESTMWFILSRIKQINFQRQCAQSEVRDICTAYQYAPKMRGTAWKTLVKRVDEKLGDYGFNKKFMEELLDNGGALEEDRWNKLIIDWITALKNKLTQEANKSINNSTHSFKKTDIIEDNIKKIEEYEKSSHIDSVEAFEQSIICMHGIWNWMEYEKMEKVATRQKKYPAVMELVGKIGRHNSEDGETRAHAEAGNLLKISHSSGADIEGISTSRSLSALLPHELACFTDDQLCDVFLQKYIQGTLQTFRYASKISKPTRKLTPTIQCSLKGPIVVCLDTSESMNGKPSQIAQSILMRVVYEARKNHRACYLIYFSVDIQVVDLIKTPESISYPKSGGGTSPQKMLEELFRVLNTNENYIMADTLWISDFCMPLPDKNLKEEMERLKNLGTKFNAIKIGEYNSTWDKSIFDTMLKIDQTNLIT